MKRLEWGYCLLLLATPAICAAQDDSDKNRRIVEQGRELASWYIRDAIKNMSDDPSRVGDRRLPYLREMYDRIRDPELKFVLTTSLDDGCKKNDYAYAITRRDRGTIYICPHLLPPETMDLKIVAQVLAHETVHSMGYTNECFATKLEYAVMIESGATPAYVSTYFEDCMQRPLESKR